MIHFCKIIHIYMKSLKYSKYKLKKKFVVHLT